jgi:hypothetical protein
LGYKDKVVFINLPCQTHISYSKGKVKIFSVINLHSAKGNVNPNRGEAELNIKTVAVVFLVAVVILGLAMPTLPVMAQIGSQIEQLSPADATGVVGQSASMVGSIDTSNGKFEVYFGTVLVATGTAQGNGVTAAFRIPEIPAGTYSIILRDVALNNNATQDFTVNTAYYTAPVVPATPEQLQEGTTVTLNVTITGGQPNTSYLANITVTLPAPLSTNYSRLVTLPTSSQKGTTTTQVNYPDTTFEPAGSLTDYAGVYKVYFNLTQSLASNQFSIGFTDLTQYHRGQTVRISAIDYQSNDTATVTIVDQESGATMFTADVTPTSAGVVATEWTVPSNAAIGDYQVKITAHNTPKLVPDSQIISIPGYPVKIRTLDLSGTPVPQIVVEALDTATNETYSGTTGDDGQVTINLENGQTVLTAFWNDLQVGQTTVTVVGEGAFDLSCELTNIKITVQDRNGLLIPSVSLDISYEYLTTKDHQQKTGSATGLTDVSGTFTMNSTPPGITYVMNASVYGAVFNVGNDTVSNLPVKAVSEVTIICPSRTLMFKIIDYKRNPIPNARLSLLEVTAGIFYGATTDSNGSVTVEATFGRYRTQVYTGSVLLNETQVDAFSDKEVEIQCVLYNLQVNVEVVDYFGQPIQNVNVRLVEPDGAVQVEKTQTGGIAVFNGVVGGDLQITAYFSESDDYYEAVNVHVESPTTVQVRMGRYILLGAFLVQTSFFLTLILVVSVLVVFLVAEVYRRRKTKRQKTVTTVGKAGSK